MHIRRLAIVNRGEAGLRALRAAQDYALMHPSRPAPRTIGLITRADLKSPYARRVDETHLLAQAENEAASAPYLDHDRLLAALKECRADAVWVGWGFVAEDAVFAQKVEDAGLLFVGPKAETMREAGDKIAAKKLAEKAQVPVVPWSQNPVANSDEARHWAQKITYPVILKAAAGGGGRGIRRVDSPDDLQDAFEKASGEALRAFGDGRMFIEKCITQARHLEVQIAGDSQGRIESLGIRDCSLQRRNQKIIEEAPGPISHGALADDLHRYARAFAKACNYLNVGTVEFIYDLETQKPYFMEMNTRLQVEHTVTELVRGIDIGTLQLSIAAGDPLPEVPAAHGYAIEARLNAEDPERGFVPAPGELVHYIPAAGPGIRIDSGVVSGATIPPDFDSMIAKIMAWGSTRQEALARLRRALGETEVLIDGGATNKTLLTQLLEHDDIVKGEIDTQWLDRNHKNFDASSYRPHAVIAAAILNALGEEQDDLINFFSAASRGVPQTLIEAEGRHINFSVGRQSVETLTYRVGKSSFLVQLDSGPLLAVEFFPQSHAAARMVIDAETYDLIHRAHEFDFAVEVNGFSYRVEIDAAGEVRSPAPALVMDIAVKVGDTVELGQRLLSLEAMKTEMPIRSEIAGVISKILVQPNAQVSAGQTLVTLDAAKEAPQKAQERIAIQWKGDTADAWPSYFQEKDFPWEKLRDENKAEHFVDALMQEAAVVLLGYDVIVSRAQGLLRFLNEAISQDRIVFGSSFSKLENLVSLFVDVERLFSTRVRATEAGRVSASMNLDFYNYARYLKTKAHDASGAFKEALASGLRHYGLRELAHSSDVEHALARLAAAHGRGNARSKLRHELLSLVLRLIMRLHHDGVSFGAQLSDTLLDVPPLCHAKLPFAADNAYQARYVLFMQPRFERRAQKLGQDVHAALDRCIDDKTREEAEASLIATREKMIRFLLPEICGQDAARAEIASRVLLKRLYSGRSQGGHIKQHKVSSEFKGISLKFPNERAIHLLAVSAAETTDLIGSLRKHVETNKIEGAINVVVPCQNDKILATLGESLREALPGFSGAEKIQTATLIGHGNDSLPPMLTLERGEDGLWSEHSEFRNLHPEQTRRLRLHQLEHFALERLASNERLVIFRATAKNQPEDERIFVSGDVRVLPSPSDPRRDRLAQRAFSHIYFEAIQHLREIQAKRDVRRRFHANWIVLTAHVPIHTTIQKVRAVANELWDHTQGLGLERVILRAEVIQDAGHTQVTDIHISNDSGHSVEVEFREPSGAVIESASLFDLKVRAANRRRVFYPYDVLRTLTQKEDNGVFPPGSFQEYDLVDEHSLKAKPCIRAFGENHAGLVFGIIRHQTKKHPEGMARVIMLSDPLMEMGALAEPECRRIIAALNLAEENGWPIEWLPISSGAKISMESGTENLDWTARVLKRIIEVTQAGQEINIIVDGVNVGAQSYFNAEATMLMHTKGILVMTARGSMVLTGKRALDYSGGVSAENELGIGGHERIMGPNGQAQYYADHLLGAFSVLLKHYEYSYRLKSEDGVRPLSVIPSRPNLDKSPYPSSAVGDYKNIAEIFVGAANRERKKPFSIRALLFATVDEPERSLERYPHWQNAENAVVLDAHLGGHAVSMIGIESEALPRQGYVPGDGPENWTGGTLFPLSSKKVARAINAASSNRPVVVMANLSGFDGSPESMRKLQLEYGAEIGRAVVNFKGPLVFLVVARYHGGAYVVFSKALNPGLQSLALKGSYASVIGGAPAAAVVFSREVERSVQTDAEVEEARRKLELANSAERPKLRENLNEIVARVRGEKQGEFARRFDTIHSVERAHKVGSLDSIVSATNLREELCRRLNAARSGENDENDATQEQKAR